MTNQPGSAAHVIPAQAGIYGSKDWISAFAEMTVQGGAGLCPANGAAGAPEKYANAGVPPPPPALRTGSLGGADLPQKPAVIFNLDGWLAPLWGS